MTLSLCTVARQKHGAFFRLLIRFLAMSALASGLVIFAAVSTIVFASDNPQLPSPSEMPRATYFCDVEGDQSVLISPDPQITSAGLVYDARAHWLNRTLVHWSAAPVELGKQAQQVQQDQQAEGTFKLYASYDGQIAAKPKTKVMGQDVVFALERFSGALPTALATRFKYLSAGVVLMVKDADLEKMLPFHKAQLVLVHENETGEVIRATRIQVAGAFDDLYAAAKNIGDLGVTVNKKNNQTNFKLWAPSAAAVQVCIYPSGESVATSIVDAKLDTATHAFTATNAGDLSGQYYQYLVKLFVPGVGMVINRVTDPYSISLTTDSKRSYIADLNSSRLKPKGWDNLPALTKVKSQTDMSIYELHVRDFSINDQTVSKANRGKYLAFTETTSNGMKHLAALSRAGMTDVHLLPVFDIATIPEKDCVVPAISGVPDGETQQKISTENAASDCFNWGYDPHHFNAPEGSYGSNPADGASRIIEFRQMVMALHRAGLRVGLDVVYNHTSASGQAAKSVLDRIVPGYYQRLNDEGKVERSTCCDNTATENMMMGKLMVDSAVLWAREYKIDSFRFDLMGHQPRSVMEELQTKVNQAVGRKVNLIGEGWNFGEVENGKRFVQASQLSLNGSGIGTFSDRARDAVRGGGPGDSGDALVKAQGYINGLFYDPNAMAMETLKANGKVVGAADKAPTKTDLMRAADMVRVGLAGTVRDFEFMTFEDKKKPLHAIDYAGQSAGYASEPGEVVNYVDNHDNQTLFDINAYKLPLNTSREDRARVQMLGAATTIFSQGVAYFHAGIDMLRSKSMDGNSYDSGDWFNRMDFSYRDNYFGTGMPPKSDNEKQYALIKPLLANANIKPTQKEIILARDMFRDLLKIRASSNLFRLSTTEEIKSRLTFLNTGSMQNPVVIVGHLNGSIKAMNARKPSTGAGFSEVLYFINVDKVAQTLVLATEKNKRYILHPVHTNAGAADKRPAADSKYEQATGTFKIPARTAMVYVLK